MLIVPLFCYLKNHNQPLYLAGRSVILGGHENGGFVGFLKVNANRLPSFQFGQKYP